MGGDEALITMVWMGLLEELNHEIGCPTMQITHPEGDCSVPRDTLGLEDHQPSNRNQEMTGWFRGYRARCSSICVGTCFKFPLCK